MKRFILTIIILLNVAHCGYTQNHIWGLDKLLNDPTTNFQIIDTLKNENASYLAYGFVRNPDAYDIVYINNRCNLRVNQIMQLKNGDRHHTGEWAKKFEYKPTRKNYRHIETAILKAFSKEEIKQLYQIVNEYNFRNIGVVLRGCEDRVVECEFIINRHPDFLNISADKYQKIEETLKKLFRFNGCSYTSDYTDGNAKEYFSWYETKIDFSIKQEDLKHYSRLRKLLMQ